MLNFKINICVYWSDRTTVLIYIKSDSLRFNFSELDQCNYVLSKTNPADHLSRGVSVSSLIGSEMWNNGPTFLRDEDLIPNQYLDSAVPDGDAEIKDDTTVLATTIAFRNPVDVLMESASSWYKLKVQISRFLKLKQFLRNKLITKDSKLSVGDLQDHGLLNIHGRISYLSLKKIGHSNLTIFISFFITSWKIC